MERLLNGISSDRWHKPIERHDLALLPLVSDYQVAALSLTSLLGIDTDVVEVTSTSSSAIRTSGGNKKQRKTTKEVDR